jgi:hypothetical protein
MDTLETIPGLSGAGQAVMVGFFNAIAGTDAPEDLEKPGYGNEAHPYYDSEDYKRGYSYGKVAGDEILEKLRLIAQFNNR